MAPILLRAASAADAHAIANIKIAAWRVAYRGIVPDRILDHLSLDDVRANWLGVSEAELSRRGPLDVSDLDV